MEASLTGEAPDSGLTVRVKDSPNMDKNMAFDIFVIGTWSIEIATKILTDMV